ncbi:glycosyltransferase family 2 protein [Actinomyces viscosus]|uniref:Putative glycosyl transferase n=2 Tax=Actinomyces viscosus TaxID=1656 RepID=A0A3S4Z6V3_ACTVI|nr:glycosyltransferase family 2 protein [Actinomyces viscosus]VEI14404.1 putative glycosyl transferase [Actinomyces viscosus]
MIGLIPGMSRGRYRPPRVSLVSPVYGVAPCLPRFLDSLDAQDYPHSRLQVVLVLDGARDESPRVCRAWARRTDLDVEIVETENGGQGRARNLGMEHARGQWIGFPDPDDWLAPDFLTRLLGARRHGDLLLSGRTLIHQGGSRTWHPLDFRFQSGTARVDAARRPQAIQLSVHECLIRSDRALAARFPEDREAPTFEDALYLGGIRAGSGRIVFVPDAVYHYDKRASGESAVQTSWSRPGRYLDQIRTRYHALLDVAGGAAWAQQTILYDLGWYFGVVDAGRMPTQPSGLGQTHAAEMRQLAQRLDVEQVIRSPWGNLGASARARLLLWKSLPEVAVVRDGEVIELYTDEPPSVQAKPLRYAGTDVGWVLTGSAAVQRYSGGDVPRIPLWPRRPRLAETLR